LSLENSNNAIFIHAWWRSSSTYVWAKLRENDHLRCYYEPLHEQVLLLTKESILSSPDVAINRSLRHPYLKKSYFYEYFDLVSASDLRFSADLSYDRYFLNSTEEDSALFTYLEGLIMSANKHNKKAVLCFCRSQMRSAWMKKNFHGVHVAQVRNPFDQWNSFKTNRYFLNGLIRIASNLRNRHQEVFSNTEMSVLNRILNLSTVKTHGGDKISLNESDLFLVFMFLWFASTIQSISIADFVLDVDMMSHDYIYRQSCSSYFKKMGIDVDFSDCHTPSIEGADILLNEHKDILVQISGYLNGAAKSLVSFDFVTILEKLNYLAPKNKKLINIVLQSNTT